MLGVEKLCKRLSSFISKELDLEKDKEAVVNYGIFSLIQIFISIGLVIVFGLIFGVLIEALIASFTGSILRKSSGGVHADSPGKCTAIGTVMCIGIGLISKKIDISISLMILIEIRIFIWSYIIIFKYAPIDSLAKPIKKEEKSKSKTRFSILFNGLTKAIKTTNENGNYYVEIEGISKTSELDIKEKSRSFQNINMTYDELISSVLKNYSEKGFIQSVGCSQKINKPIFQYKETDWNFLKRICSELNSEIYCDIISINNLFYFGRSKGKT